MGSEGVTENQVGGGPQITIVGVMSPGSEPESEVGTNASLLQGICHLPESVPGI